MARRAPPFVLVLVLVLVLEPLLSGCATSPPSLEEMEAFYAARGVALPSLAEKAASFRPFEKDRVAGEPLAAYLERRLARLVGIDAEGRPAFGGSAVAVARDGYFLTAAHCVVEPRVRLHVASARGGRSWAEARLVVRGDEVDGEDQDVALLKVDHALAAAFEWAAPGEVLADEPAVAAGHGRRLELEAAAVFSGGKFLAPLPPPAGGPVPTSIAAAQMPFVFGDSGGALATRSGRLVGICTRFEDEKLLDADGSVRFADRWAEAVRPDPAWVARAIARDRRARGAAAVPPELARALAARTALVEARVLEIDAPGGGRIRRRDVSTALALTGDGYWLAAGHAVRGEPIFLTVAAPPTASDPPTRVPARVVASRDLARGEPDLAILKTDAPAPAAFEWAAPAAVTAGARLLSVAASPARPSPARRFAPATVLGPAPPGPARLAHDLPLEPSDMGGALVTYDGRLAGIHVRGLREFFETLVPDRAWIEAAIARDRKARTSSDAR